MQKSYFTKVDASGGPLQNKTEIASYKWSPFWYITVWEENRNGVKECFYSIIGSDGQILDNGIAADTSTFGHKIETDITYVGGHTFAINYTASTQYEVHFFLLSYLMLCQ